MRPGALSAGVTAWVGALLLVAASLVVGTAIVLDRFPELTSDLLAQVMDRDSGHTGHDMKGTQ
jgi:hypothetical protein